MNTIIMVLGYLMALKILCIIAKYTVRLIFNIIQRHKYRRIVAETNRKKAEENKNEEKHNTN